MGRYRMRDVGIRSLLREVKVYVMLPEALWLELRSTASRHKVSMHQALLNAVSRYVDTPDYEHWGERPPWNANRNGARSLKRPPIKDKLRLVQRTNTEVDPAMNKAEGLNPGILEEHKRASSMLRSEEEPVITPAPEPLNAQTIPNEGWEEGVRERLRDELAGQQVLFSEEEPVREISKRRK